MSQALPFVIRVLEGPLSNRLLQTGQPLGQVSLTGRQMPLRGLRYSGRQRVKTTWYPGNSAGTQQVMGPTEDPTVVNGIWGDRFLGDGAARAYALLFDTLRRSGAPLAVVWGGGTTLTEDGVVVSGDQFNRHGVLSMFEATFDRPQDCTWSAEFTWSSQGEVVAPVITTTGVENPRDGLAAFVQAVQFMAGKLRAFVEQPYSRIVNFTQAFQDNVDALANSALVMADILGSTADVTNRVLDMPTYVVERGIAVTTQTVFQLQQLDAAIQQQDPLDYEVQDDPVQLLDCLESRLGLLQQSAITQQTAQDTAASLTGLLFPELLAEVTPRAGSDLRDLAKQYYGDPELWWLIAQENGLASSRVPTPPDGPSDSPFSNRTLRIPARRTGSLGEIRRSC